MPTPLTHYVHLGHRRVEGWIEPPILHVLAGLAKEQSDAGVKGGIVEIGVHHGRLFIAMHLTRQPGEKSLAIDLFENQDANVDRSGRGDEARFRENLRRYSGTDSDVEIWTADSTTLTGDTIKEVVGPVRLFDVDGGHTAEIVAHDLSTSANSLVDGGIVLSDDMFNEKWPGVHEGTVGFARTDPRLVPFGIGFNKTMFTTATYAARYRKVLSALAGRYLWLAKESEMYGHPVTVVWLPNARTKGKLAIKHWIYEPVVARRAG